MFSTIWEEAMQFLGWFRYYQPTARHASSSQLTRRTSTRDIPVNHQGQAPRGTRRKRHQPPQLQHKQEEKHSTRHESTGSQQTSQGTRHTGSQFGRTGSGITAKSELPKRRGKRRGEALHPVLMLGQLRGLSERGRQAGGGWGVTRGKCTITHWVSLWDVIDPFLLLTGGNLHSRSVNQTAGYLRQWNSLYTSTQRCCGMLDADTSP